MWAMPQNMIFLATGHHDMGKRISGLALAVADTLCLDLESRRQQAIRPYQHWRDE